MCGRAGGWVLGAVVLFLVLVLVLVGSGGGVCCSFYAVRCAVVHLPEKDHQRTCQGSVQVQTNPGLAGGAHALRAECLERWAGAKRPAS